MRTKWDCLIIALALLAGVHQAAGQFEVPVITTFNQSGLLVCSNLLPGTVASVQWASSLSGPWHSDWTGPGAVAVNSKGLLRASVPMYYRVAGVPYFTNLFTSDGMRLIPAGAFIMGDTLDGDSNAIPIWVTVSPFYMDTNLVSYAQWQAVYNWAANNGYAFDDAGSGKAPDNPVRMVNWYDAVKWCNARSQQAGLAPVYYTDANFTQIYVNGDVDSVYANWTANGYRLPTEAEWEKAARGGLSGQRFPWGDTISESQANYAGQPSVFSYDLGPRELNPEGQVGGYPYTSPVGYFAANGYGLYDMAGNVYEWCWDWYGTPYGQPTTTNPTGPATGNYRITRGGGFGAQADAARCAKRLIAYPSTYSGGSYGFRCVRGL